MIIGAPSIIYSKSPDADRAFLRDALGLTGVDVGGGWLIFGLPPAEVAVHPSDENDIHEFYLMCDDVEALAARPRRRTVEQVLTDECGHARHHLRDIADTRRAHGRAQGGVRSR